MSVVNPGPGLEPPPNPPGGVYVHGLRLVGAGWDVENGQLCDAKRGQTSVPLPMLWLRPVQTVSQPADRAAVRAAPHSPGSHASFSPGRSVAGEDAEHEDEQEEEEATVSVPVFSSTSRLERITELRLPCVPGAPDDHWLLRGACIVCESDSGLN
ncbi:hypothetical protein FNF31_03690 [Cafeteria roenbergensis]|nr:hypothetical protein FNF31_03690 [Cafeteria roenbergensis]